MHEVLYWVMCSMQLSMWWCRSQRTKLKCTHTVPVICAVDVVRMFSHSVSIHTTTKEICLRCGE